MIIISFFFIKRGHIENLKCIKNQFYIFMAEYSTLTTFSLAILGAIILRSVQTTDYSYCRKYVPLALKWINSHSHKSVRFRNCCCCLFLIYNSGERDIHNFQRICWIYILQAYNFSLLNFGKCCHLLSVYRQWIIKGLKRY